MYQTIEMKEKTQEGVRLMLHLHVYYIYLLVSAIVLHVFFPILSISKPVYIDPPKKKRWGGGVVGDVNSANSIFLKVTGQSE